MSFRRSRRRGTRGCCFRPWRASWSTGSTSAGWTLASHRSARRTARAAASTRGRWTASWSPTLASLVSSLLYWDFAQCREVRIQQRRGGLAEPDARARRSTLGSRAAPTNSAGASGLLRNEGLQGTTCLRAWPSRPAGRPERATAWASTPTTASSWTAPSSGIGLGRGARSGETDSHAHRHARSQHSDEPGVQGPGARERWPAQDLRVGLNHFSGAKIRLGWNVAPP